MANDFINSTQRMLEITQDCSYGWTLDVVKSFLDGWKPVKEYFYILHDRDYKDDGITPRDPHIHLMIKFKNPTLVSNVLARVKSIGLPDTVIPENNIRKIRVSWSAAVNYLTHRDEHKDYKYVYDVSDVYSNSDYELAAEKAHESAKNKVTIQEMSDYDKVAYDLGLSLKPFNDWYDSLPFVVRSHSGIRTIKESYYRGADRAIACSGEIPRLCLFICGPAGIGKSYATKFALNQIGIESEYIYEVTSIGTGKFDDLTVNHKALVFNDTGMSADVLNAADNKPCKLHRRNSNFAYWCGEYLIVTSNLCLENWMRVHNISSFNFDAVRSRFIEIRVDENGNVDFDDFHCRSVLYRDELKSRFDMFLCSLMRSFNDKAYSEYMSDFDPESYSFDFCDSDAL